MASEPPNSSPSSDGRSDYPAPQEPAWPAYYVDPETGHVLPYSNEAWFERRLHPATIVVQVVRFLKSIALLIAIAVAMRLSGRSGDTIEIIATLLGVFSVAGAVFKYLSFRYWISGGSLHVRSGIIHRKDAAIPLERIQNINFRQELIHRILGVADVHIETASGGGDSEASLSVVSLSEAEALRAALMRQTASYPSAYPPGHSTTPGDAAGQGVETPAVVEPPPEVVYRATLGDLILAGATTNRLGTLIGTAIGLFITAQALLGRDEMQLGRWIEQQARRMAVPAWTTVAVGMAGLVLLGWITSIVLSVVGRYGFQLARVRGQLERSFGLTTRHHSIFPVQRVQILKIRSPLIQRWLGLCHVSAETAGSFRDSGGRGEGQGTSELCPILSRRRLDEIARLALPALSFDAIDWRPTSRLAQWRAFSRSTATLLIAVAVAGWFGHPWIWAGAAIVPIFTLIWSALYYKAIGYAIQNDHIGMRGGVMTRMIRIVPFAKVQASFVTQSPLQLRLGLATLRVLTAGIGFGVTASVPDLPLATAVELQELLQRRPTPVLATEAPVETVGAGAAVITGPE